jgi:hypothetical protein
MDPSRASHDVEFLRDLLGRTRRRVDPHAFHMVLWGGLVLLAYPVLNALQNAERMREMLVVGGIALGLGVLGSLLLEWRLRHGPRLEAEDTALSRHVARIVLVNVLAGAVLSVLAPASRWIEGWSVPVVWGFVYASMAIHIGLVYSRDFVWSGVFLFAGACAAMFLPAHAGYVLGPVMGLGMIVPGVLAERRVQRLRREDLERGPGTA